VRLHPHGLQLGVRVARELVVLQQGVQLAVVALLEGDYGAGADDRLVLGEQVGAGDDRERPEEAGQARPLAAPSGALPRPPLPPPDWAGTGARR